MARDLPVVVLTGGVASGKTEVSKRLAAAGALVIDTDIIAKDITRAGQPGHQAIATHWGESVLMRTGPQKGELDRRALRHLVFADDEQRQALEQLLHPLIMDEVKKQLRAANESSQAPYAVVVIPLYAETPSILQADAVVVVDVPREQQHKRLMARDGVDTELAEQMLNAQASREQRLALATDVIDNSKEIGNLEKEVDHLNQKLKARFSRD
ncbi:MAG TPA: dephospho-CoA kinase [Wenzhouxiangella sp.]